MKIIINPNAKVQFYEIGVNKTPILVVDNFLENATELRDLALTLSYSIPPAGRLYPGFNSQLTIPGLKKMTAWITEKMIKYHFPKKIPNHIVLNNFQDQHAIFAVLSGDKNKDGSKGVVTFSDKHVDTKPGHWLAAVLHLSLFNEARATAFWRFKPLNLEHYVYGSNIKDIALLYRLEKDLGLNLTKPIANLIDKKSIITYPVLQSDISKTDYHTVKENQDWKLIKFVKAKFNRIIIYPVWQIHSIIDETNIKTLTVDNMRLTMNTFIPLPYRFKIEEPYAETEETYNRKFYRPVKGLIIEGNRINNLKRK